MSPEENCLGNEPVEIDVDLLSYFIVKRGRVVYDWRDFNYIQIKLYFSRCWKGMCLDRVRWERESWLSLKRSDRERVNLFGASGMIAHLHLWASDFVFIHCYVDFVRLSLATESWWRCDSHNIKKSGFRNIWLEQKCQITILVFMLGLLTFWTGLFLFFCFFFFFLLSMSRTLKKITKQSNMEACKCSIFQIMCTTLKLGEVEETIWVHQRCLTYV